MSVPDMRPMAVVALSPARMASHQGRLYGGATRAAIRPAPMPATKTMERSISPSRRTKTSPMANMMNTTAWLNRLTMLPADRNREVCSSKTTMMATRPMTTGRTPLSPERTLLPPRRGVLRQAVGHYLGGGRQACWLRALCLRAVVP